MIEFEFHAPDGLEEVFSLLETHGDNARVMSGGTALVIMMKQRLAQPEHVVSLQRVPGLSYIKESEDSPGAVEVGALCTQRRVETDPLIGQKVPLVAEAFRRIATPRIRHMATIGGGLVHGDPNQDPPPTLIALGASVVLTSSSSQRIVPVEDLFIDYFETDLQPGEVLTSILIPPAPPGSGAAYLKFLSPSNWAMNCQVPGSSKVTLAFVKSAGKNVATPAASVVAMTGPALDVSGFFM